MDTSEGLEQEVQRILAKYNMPLKRAIKGELTAIAGEFLSRKIISQDSADRVGERAVDRLERAARLLTDCRPLLVGYPLRYFPAFIDALKTCPSTTLLAQEIEKDFNLACEEDFDIN